MAKGDRPTRRVILAGGSGFLGMGLAGALSAAGYEPVILTRGKADESAGVPRVHWDARTAGEWARWLEEAYAIVNLVGRSVDCRKTAANRREILESRIDSVSALSKVWRACANPPKVWVQAATAHIYGDTGDEMLVESSPIPDFGLAPMVGRAWEEALNSADLPGVRNVILRISFVLGRHGGALRTMARLARWFLGGTVGSGRQWISWIHEIDLHRIILRALADESMSGVYLTTAPKAVTNREFMAELRRAMHRPWAPPTPAPLVRLGSWLMRTDPDLALLGRRCVPRRLLEEGFEFLYRDLGEALRDLLSPPAGPGGAITAGASSRTGPRLGSSPVS